MCAAEISGLRLSRKLEYVLTGAEGLMASRSADVLKFSDAGAVLVVIASSADEVAAK
jgi:hypothetical protein